MSELQFKTVDVEVKGEGHVVSKIATLDEVDRQGDFATEGFLGEQHVQMKWNHGLPFINGLTIGKGTAAEQGKDVLFDGHFNLKMTTGSDVYEQVLFDLENGEPLQEWSYGYFVLNPNTSTQKSMPDDAVRHLGPMPDGSPGVEVKEVSPVSLRGAGNNTGTLQVKSLGLTYDDNLQFADGLIDELVERTEALAALRAQEGRSLSEPKLKALSDLAAKLEQITAFAERVTDDDDAVNVELLRTERNRFLRMEAHLSSAF